MSDIDELIESSGTLAEEAAALSDRAVSLTEKIVNLQLESQSMVITGVDPFIYAVTVFILACFIGYYVVWKVTPALHTPLMSVTNAISSIIVVGAILAAGGALVSISETLGLLATFIASINIFGGFIVTQRMLRMFRKKGK